MSAIAAISTANHLYESTVRRLTPGQKCNLNVLGGALTINQPSAAAGFQGDLTIRIPDMGSRFDARA